MSDDDNEFKECPICLHNEGDHWYEWPCRHKAHLDCLAVTFGMPGAAAACYRCAFPPNPLQAPPPPTAPHGGPLSYIMVPNMVILCCPRVQLAEAGPVLPPDDRRMHWSLQKHEWQCLTCNKILKKVDLDKLLPKEYKAPSCGKHGKMTIYVDVGKGEWGATCSFSIGGLGDTSTETWAIDDVPVPYNCYKVHEGRIINDGDRWYDNEKLGQLVEMIE